MCKERRREVVAIKGRAMGSGIVQHPCGGFEGAIMKGAEMKVTTTFSRLCPDTIQGEKIAILTVYSSMNKQEIDELEQSLYQIIGNGVISGVKEQENE